MSKEEKIRFDVMAIPNPRSYVIVPDKWQEFLNYKPNPDTVKRNEEMVQKFKKNILSQTEEPKKKIRKPWAKY